MENVVLDSLLFLTLLPRGPISVADLGSGAGVPGIPLKIVRPELRMVLIEARERRVSFLSTVIRELSLPECRVVGERAERVAPEDRNHDVVVMRCAGDLTEIIPIAARLIRSGGMVVASGPPRRPANRKGLGLEWVEIEGVQGRRLFAVYRGGRPPASTQD
jgi:16S rRNA (guanine527-N7)-methyltransferase